VCVVESSSEQGVVCVKSRNARTDSRETDGRVVDIHKGPGIIDDAYECIHTYIRCGRQGTAALQHTRDCNWAAQTQTIDSLDCIRRAVCVCFASPAGRFTSARFSSAQFSFASRKGKTCLETERRRHPHPHHTMLVHRLHTVVLAGNSHISMALEKGREMHQLSGAHYSSSNSYKGADRHIESLSLSSHRSCLRQPRQWTERHHQSKKHHVESPRPYAQHYTCVTKQNRKPVFGAPTLGFVGTIMGQLCL